MRDWWLQANCLLNAIYSIEASNKRKKQRFIVVYVLRIVIGVCYEMGNVHIYIYSKRFNVKVFFPLSQSYKHLLYSIWLRSQSYPYYY